MPRAPPLISATFPSTRPMTGHATLGTRTCSSSGLALRAAHSNSPSSFTVLPTLRSFPAAHLSDSVAAIASGPPGPRVGAFFDLDGTLVAGFTATAHAGHRIRRGQASIGELLGILEASVRYRLGRMQFERLLERAAGYLRGELMSDLDELGEQLFARDIASRMYPHMLEIVR